MHRMVKRAVEMEGTVTGEHGVGLVKRDYLEHELGETTVDTMRRVSLHMHSYSFPFLPQIQIYPFSTPMKHTTNTHICIPS